MSDYRIQPTDLQETGAKTIALKNIAAIQLLKELEASRRVPSNEQQAVLAQYRGWGAAFRIFDDSPDSDWLHENEVLRSLLTEEEYEAAQHSILNAYYTPPDLIQVIHEGLNHLGFYGGKTLEPALGTGLWYGCQPEADFLNSKKVGVEIDPVSGRIAQLLYQSATIYIQGFEATRLPNNEFDVVFGNAPFGTTVPVDPEYEDFDLDGLHNYFFVKGLDKTRPGGLLALITSVGTLQSSKANEVREYLASQSNLVAAFRLPANTFQSFTNTGVTVDIIVLQKLGADIEPNGVRWTDLVESGLQNEGGNALLMNEYYADHPEHLKPIRKPNDL